MKKGSRAVLRIVLLLALLFSAGGLLGESVRAEGRDKARLAARQAAGVLRAAEAPGSEPAPEDPHAAALLNVDLAALQAVNPDVLGWISIPDTPISYPLLQGEDNSYYLEHTWQKEYNPGGSIFMECRNNSDFSSFNTIIYGHRMSDSSMFNSLRHYDSAEYLAQHPKVYIATDAGVRVYEIFAACEVMVTDPVYRLITTQEDYKQAVIDFCLERSVVDAPIVPQADDRLLTLSTCVDLMESDRRWVVVAVEGETIN